jgi:hypothetical protein
MEMLDYQLLSISRKYKRNSEKKRFTDEVLVVVSAWETCFIDASISRFVGKKFGNGRSRNAKCELRPGG